MSNNENTFLKGIIRRIDGKAKDVLLMLSLALVLLFASWMIFRADDVKNVVSVNATEAEMKVMRLLEEIDGVGGANVIVYEGDEGAESVVVVCEGANDLQVIMNVREAVAAAVGVEEKAVKIYLKKE